MLFSSQLKNSPSDHPVLDDLSQSGSELALRQSFQTVKINYHGNRLPEGANHVFAERVVHCGFAADRRVDLRQQRGRDWMKRTPR